MEDVLCECSGLGVQNHDDVMSSRLRRVSEDLQEGSHKQSLV